MPETYQIDCEPDGTVDIKRSDGPFPDRSILMTMPEPNCNVEIVITGDFVKNVYRRLWGVEL